MTGCGDLRGLISRLDYLARLGVTCLWLNPVHPSPLRDNGYDVSDYYGIDPRLGTLGDFAELAPALRGARHPDRARPGGQPHLRRAPVVRSPLAATRPRRTATGTSGARRSRRTGSRAWSSPASRRRPGPSSEQAGAWYFHRFYGFQPDLNWSHPAVRAEIAKVMGFWLQLGASGFRVDAAPFVLEQISPGVDPGPMDYSILDAWRQDDAVAAG